MKPARHLASLFFASFALAVGAAGAGADRSASAPGSTAGQLLAFPGAEGRAAKTPGGRGGRIIRVTTLAADGPGSLREAVEAKGPRIVVFEVGGVIDLARSVLDIREPYLTIAGQTAPSPGITIIRGGIDVRGHDVVIRHIRVRTGVDGQPKLSGWEADSLSTAGAYNVIIDHCTFSWALDENMSASGPRFTGSTVAEWRKGTSHDITFSYNLAAEGIADGSHPKGEHSKGSLIHDNATGILIWRNVYAHNVERSPLLKGGVQAVLVNNLIYNPGQKAVHYNLMALEWGRQPYVTGELSAVGNELCGAWLTRPGLPFLMLGGDGDLRYHGRDNLSVDLWGKPLPAFGRYGADARQTDRGEAAGGVAAGAAVFPHVMSRRMCSGKWAPARGIATSTISACCSLSQKGGARSSTTRRRSAVIRFRRRRVRRSSRPIGTSPRWSPGPACIPARRR